MAGEKFAEKVMKIAQTPKQIRNIATSAHIHHGKTAMTDNLLAAAGMMSSKFAGQLEGGMATWQHLDEQERLMTVDAANVSMVHEFNDEEYGKLLENYVLGKLRSDKVNYWRTTAKAEVDFISAEKMPVEIKMQPKITRSFRSFIESYKPQTAFLANLNTYDKAKMGTTTIFFVPLALL